jgi:hypothetical protein
MEVERAFRTLKGSLSLRPIYHSKDDRIRSHVRWCWLALLFVSIAEVETQMSWPKIKHAMQRLNLVEFLTKDGILQHTELISPINAIYWINLRLNLPKQFSISIWPPNFIDIKRFFKSALPLVVIINIRFCKPMTVERRSRFILEKHLDCS